jgi:hypothetical protein
LTALEGPSEIAAVCRLYACPLIGYARRDTEFFYLKLSWAGAQLNGEARKNGAQASNGPQSADNAYACA